MGVIDDEYGGYENVMAHGGDFMAAYYSQLPPAESEMTAQDHKDEATSCFRDGLYAEALESYRIAGMLDPSLLAVCSSNSAQCLLLMKNWSEAEDECRKGLAANPSPNIREKLVYRLAVAFREQGRAAEALQAVQAASLRRSPEVDTLIASLGGAAAPPRPPAAPPSSFAGRTVGLTDLAMCGVDFYANNVKGGWARERHGAVDWVGHARLAAEIVRQETTAIVVPDFSNDEGGAGLSAAAGQALRLFAESGGLVIFCGGEPLCVCKLLHEQGFGVAWERGQYYRLVHTRTAAALAAPAFKNLPPALSSFSCKAGMLKGVPPEQRMFMPAPGARTASLVPSMSGLAIDNVDECVAVAAARVGAGCVVFLGDVNAEAATCELVRGMCAMVAAAPAGGGAPKRAAAGILLG